jgi:hypothetical protein
VLEVAIYVNTRWVGAMHLRNITEGDGVREDGTSDYRVDFFDDDDKRKSGIVTNFQRDQGFWKLIETALPYAPERDTSGRR